MDSSTIVATTAAAATNADQQVSTMTTTTMPPPPPLNALFSIIEALWNALAQNVFLPICWFGTLLLLTFLLVCYRWKQRYIRVARGAISMPMLAFLLSHLANSVVFIFSRFIVNPIVTLNPDVLNQNNWLNTWWSFWVGNYLLVMPVNIFFLVMDRLLALVLSVRYTREQQKRFGRLCFAALFLVYAFSLLDVLIAWPYSKMCNTPGTEDNPIGNRACLPLFNRIVNFAYQFIKIVFAVLNILLSIIFIIKLHRASIVSVKNGVVKMTIFCELIFDAIPALASLLFSIANIEINLNDYTFLMASLDATLCSLGYALIMFNRKRTGTVAAANTKFLHSTASSQQQQNGGQIAISSVSPTMMTTNNSINNGANYIARRGTFATTTNTQY